MRWTFTTLITLNLVACGFDARTVPDASNGDPIDAAAPDAEVPDAMCLDAEVCNGVDDTCDTLIDEGCVAPGAPTARFPWNGYATGSIHATLGTVDPLRPTFRWDAAIGTLTHYALRLTTVCAVSAWRTCDLSAVVPIQVSGTTYTPTADLAVSLTAPVGSRYYWTVAACNGAACSAPTAIRYVDVGRLADDVNGDGYSDLLAGAMYNGPSMEGHAYLFLGGTGGLASTNAGDYTTADANATLGTGVTLGDTNADGFADVVVGVPREDSGGTNRGLVCVYLGGSTGPSTDPGCDWVPTMPNDQGFFGWNMAVGDLDVDGYGDLVVSASQEATYGRLWIYKGTSAGPTTTVSAGPYAQPPQSGGNFAYGLDASADFNGDGAVDLIAGSGITPANGSVYVYNGRIDLAMAPRFPATTPSRTIDAPLSGCNGSFGNSLDTGDVDNDGYSDAVISCQDVVSNGQVSIYKGSSSGLPTAASLPLLPNPQVSSGAAFGRVALGDLTGDGRDDLVSGAAYNEPAVGGATDEGIVYTYPTDTSGALGSAIVTTDPGNDADAKFGFTVKGHLDLNGDGLRDVVIAAPYQDGPGAIFSYLGNTASTIVFDKRVDNPVNDADGSFGLMLHH